MSDGPFAKLHLKRHRHLAREGEDQKIVYLIEEGWAARYRLLCDGRRQINSLFLPGDYCEPQWILSTAATHPIIALTEMRVLAIPIDPDGDRHKIRSGLTKSILRGLYQMVERQSDWMVSLGRKTAHERLSALFCDLYDRLRANGKVIDNACPMPLTQSDLADVTGLTPVHVNRVLQSLRSDGLVQLDAKRLCLLDLNTLRVAAAGRPIHHLLRVKRLQVGAK